MQSNCQERVHIELRPSSSGCLHARADFSQLLAWKREMQNSDHRKLNRIYHDYTLLRFRVQEKTIMARKPRYNKNHV